MLLRPPCLLVVRHHSWVINKVGTAGSNPDGPFARSSKLDLAHFYTLQTGTEAG